MKLTLEPWAAIFGETALGIPGVGLLLFSLAVIAVVYVPVYWMTWYFNEKFGADFQARVGPYQLKPWGIPFGLARILSPFVKNRPIGREWWIESIYSFFLLWVSVFTLVTLPLGSLTPTQSFETSVIWSFLPFVFGAVLIALRSYFTKGLSQFFETIEQFSDLATLLFVALTSVVASTLVQGSLSWKIEPEVWYLSTVFEKLLLLLFAIPFYTVGLIWLKKGPFRGLNGSEVLRRRNQELTYEMSEFCERVLKFSFWVSWNLITVNLFLGGGWPARGLFEIPVMLIKLVPLYFAVIWIGKSSVLWSIEQGQRLIWEGLNWVVLVGITLLILVKTGGLSW